jgi:type IV pilus assembly protein PilV
MLKPFRRCASPAASRGVTMMEVLVTLLIVTLGLLGAAGMQARLQVAEMESYQRAQAVVFIQDMVDRINANRRNAASYDTTTLGSTLGTGTTLDCSAPATQALKDACEWSTALLGAAETSGGNKVGAMIGAIGCIELTTATMPREAKVSLVWQGLNPTRAPLSTTCGSGSYTDDATRRAMVAFVKVGCLQNDPGTGVCVTP